jgi:hypothetical protein
MDPPSEEHALRQALHMLSDLLGVQPSSASLEYAPRATPEARSVQPDAVANVGRQRFLMEYKRAATAASVTSAIAQVRSHGARSRSASWLLIVPFMNELGRARCQEAGLSWVDLSGNADISGPGIRISVLGRPNAFRSRGRPSNLFAAKSSRVARILIYRIDETLTQRQLANLAHLGEGYVSRIVRGLESAGLVARRPDGGVKVTDPELLIDAWQETYDFSKHRNVRGHVPARSGAALLKSLSNSLSESEVEHVATGLGAAWLYTHFASFRTATLIVKDLAATEVLSKIGFSPADEGANAWLVVPNDESVFWEARRLEGIPCAHPLQVYLDLKGHPERAKEAADEIRRTVLRRSK